MIIIFWFVITNTIDEAGPRPVKTMTNEMMPYLRMINLALALLCVLVLALWNGRRPGRWALTFPVVFWLLHISLFYSWLLGCCTWPVTPPALTHTLWSSIIRFQALFTVLIVGGVLLARYRDG